MISDIIKDKEARKLSLIRFPQLKGSVISNKDFEYKKRD